MLSTLRRGLWLIWVALLATHLLAGVSSSDLAAQSPPEEPSPTATESLLAPGPEPAPPLLETPLPPPATGSASSEPGEEPTPPDEVLLTPAPESPSPPPDDPIPTARPTSPTDETLLTLTSEPAPSAAPDEAPPAWTPTPTLIPPSTPVPAVGAAVVSQANPGDVVINEIAWGGSSATGSDQWIELYNASTDPITLTRWSLVALDGTPAFSLTGVMQPGAFFLMERDDDDTIVDIPADLIYNGGLNDDGEVLQLLDSAGGLVDTANAAGGPWPAGSSGPEAISMERTHPLAPDLPGNWANNNGVIRYGVDIGGNPINGTPRQPNSTIYPVLPGDVVINEVAWAGTQANASHEWIELANNTDRDIDLAGYQLVVADGVPDVTLAGIIAAEGFYLIERDDDSTVSDVTADLVVPFGEGLSDAGESLRLITGTLTIDTANGDAGPWPAGAGPPTPRSMERLAPTAADTDLNWVANDGFHRNGLDAGGYPIDGTPRSANSATIPPLVLISEVLYHGVTVETQGDEFVEVCNAQPGPINLTGLKIGDEETAGGREGMYHLPAGRALDPDQCLVVAKNAAGFAGRFGFYPDFELVVTGPGYLDTPIVPQLVPYTAWGSGNWALADDGDEVVILGPGDRRLDGVAYGSGDYSAAGVAGDKVNAPRPHSLQRMWPTDTDLMPADFARQTPSPGMVTGLPDPPASPPPSANLPGGMHAFWGILTGHSSYWDGAGPPVLAFATGRANDLHFLGITDSGSTLSANLWDDTGVRAANARIPGEFMGLRGYQYAHPLEGHITVWNTPSFVAHTDPWYNTLTEFYGWLSAQPDALAQFNQPSGSGDWPDFAYNALVAPVVCTWPVSSGSNSGSQIDPLETMWMRMLAAGWQLAPVPYGGPPAGDWGAGTAYRTGLVAPALTEAGLLDAIRARRVFATQDSNLALSLRSGDTWMGSTMSTASTLSFSVNAVDLDVAEPITLTLFDRALPLASATFAASPVEWSVTVPGQPGHFYWVRAVQSDGDIARSAPIWTDGTPAPEAVVVNEILPAPHAVDWDGDGTSDYRDEWIELYNADSKSVGLGGLEVQDRSGALYVVPLGPTISPGGYALLYHRQTDLTLNNEADTVTLRRLDGSVADIYGYESGPGYDVTLCRLPNGIGDWDDGCQPTPGSANRALPVPGPVKTDIFGARRLPLGSWVRVKGRITVPPGLFSYRVAYIQDSNSGIRVYLPKDHGLWFDLGDKVEVTGHTGTYHHELQIKVTERQDVDRREGGNPLPPLPITAGVMVEPYEGYLVLLDGHAVGSGSGRSFWLDDGNGQARIYVDPDAPISYPHLQAGQSAQVVGVVSQYHQDDDPTDGGYRLLPRYSFDLIVEQPPSPVEWPPVLPETGQR